MKPTNIPEHENIVELLPWYANSTLTSNEQQLVAQHLQDCKACQQQFEQFRQLNFANKSINNTETWQPSASQFSKLMLAIDAEENAVASKPIAPTQKPSWFARLSAWLKSIPRPVSWFMAMETVALAVLILHVGVRLPQLENHSSVFQTLSDAQPPGSSQLPRLAIAFADNISEQDMRTLLQAQHAQIVQGPSLLGVYTLQLDNGGEPALQAALNNLRASSKVKLVEAIGGAGQ